jgi:MFS family permease
MELRHNDKKAVQLELLEIEKIANLPKEGIKTLLKIAKPALIAACGLAILQQFVGINAALYYGPKIAASILPFNGNPNSVAAWQHSQFIAIIFGVINVIATFITVLVIDRFKNRSLLYVGAVAMCVSSIMLAIVAMSNGKIPGIVGIIFVCTYIISFAFSWGPIIWNTIGEIFPLSVRGIGASIATCCNWVANGIIMTLYPMIIQEQQDGSSKVQNGAIIFAVFCIVCVFFVKKYVPETKGESLEQIEEIFRGMPTK